MSSDLLTASVVIPTYNRPHHLATCLRHLEKQETAPSEIVVVDASADNQSRQVVAMFPSVRYLRNERGAGSTATSRAIGVAHTTSDIVAFLDDDAYAEPDWLAELLAPYADPEVGGVGGRALNGRPGEELEGAGQIGLFLDNGFLTGNFANDTGRVIDVNHLLGANMSLRRSALEAVGGIRDHYPGTCLREETDPALRLLRAGWRLRYAPAAVVRHVAGPYAKGRRFDLRYSYYAQRNHLVLLSSTGHQDRARRYVGATLRLLADDLGHRVRLTRHQGPALGARSVAAGSVRATVTVAGLLAGEFHAARARAADRRSATPAALHARRS